MRRPSLTTQMPSMLLKKIVPAFLQQVVQILEKHRLKALPVFLLPLQWPLFQRLYSTDKTFRKLMLQWHGWTLFKFGKIHADTNPPVQF